MAEPAKLHPGPAPCQGSLCLPWLCSAARARLPFPSRLLQAAISHTDRMCVPSVLHVPAMPWPHGHEPCTSQPAKLSARTAMCSTATWAPCPTVFIHTTCGLHHLCVHCCVCLGEIACCACPLCALLRTQPGCSPRHAGVASRRVVPPRAAGHGPLQRSAAVPGLSARRALADGLDLPNASRTNKTFRSGIARGARRQASAEVLRLRIVWAGGVLCLGLSAAPSTPFPPELGPSRLGDAVLAAHAAPNQLLRG